MGGCCGLWTGSNWSGGGGKVALRYVIGWEATHFESAAFACASGLARRALFLVGVKTS
jgi:hypothetical protein